jgi:hypothetical protein
VVFCRLRLSSLGLDGRLMRHFSAIEGQPFCAAQCSNVFLPPGFPGCVPYCIPLTSEGFLVKPKARRLGSTRSAHFIASCRWDFCFYCCGYDSCLLL